MCISILSRYTTDTQSSSYTKDTQILLIHPLCVHASDQERGCVCVCVCARAREREREADTLHAQQHMGCHRSVCVSNLSKQICVSVSGGLLIYIFLYLYIASMCFNEVLVWRNISSAIGGTGKK